MRRIAIMSTLAALALAAPAATHAQPNGGGSGSGGSGGGKSCKAGHHGEFTIADGKDLTNVFRGPKGRYDGADVWRCRNGKACVTMYGSKHGPGHHEVLYDNCHAARTAAGPPPRRRGSFTVRRAA